MKNYIPLLLFILLLTSCSPKFVQVFDTKSVNVSSINGNHIYENDTVKITYYFWKEKGVMAFAIYNKLDKPIYIDWKNSSFICNDRKLDYWIDEQTTNAQSYYGGYYYKMKANEFATPGNPIHNILVNEGFQNTTSIISKPERITFIPPKSFYVQARFHLIPFDFFKMDEQKATKIKSYIITLPKYKSDDTLYTKTYIYQQEFNLSDSPLRFRNYIAIKLSEESKDLSFVDNEFYISSVKEMSEGYFYSKSVAVKYSSFYVHEEFSNSLQNKH